VKGDHILIIFSAPDFTIESRENNQVFRRTARREESSVRAEFHGRNGHCVAPDCVPQLVFWFFTARSYRGTRYRCGRSRKGSGRFWDLRVILRGL
jgi:hypothetical protein